MDIEFDPAKDAINLAKHRISLSAAAGFDMDTALVTLDDREDYGEDRWLAIGFIKAFLHVLIFAERNERIRPISLRKAQKIEEKHYVKQKRD